MSHATEPLAEEAGRTPMWLPAVGLGILFTIAVVVVALPASPRSERATTPAAAPGEGAPADTTAREKPPEGTQAPAPPGAPTAPAAPGAAPPGAPPPAAVPPNGAAAPTAQAQHG